MDAWRQSGRGINLPVPHAFHFLSTPPALPGRVMFLWFWHRWLTATGLLCFWSMLRHYGINQFSGALRGCRLNHPPTPKVLWELNLSLMHNLTTPSILCLFFMKHYFLSQLITVNYNMKSLRCNKVKLSTFTASPANHWRTSFIGLMKYPFTAQSLFSNTFHAWF